ncbi:MAG: hypothetical protein HY446_01475 [Candidatus Niyogibacteria bacterium]|nr:hypothetical protein [Candidatus Niyogibacteria bacterium]
MTRNGTLQKLVVGVILLLVGLTVSGYVVYHEYLISSNPFAFLAAGLGAMLGATFVVGAFILFGSAIGDWRAKRAFERTFGVELPSWRRDLNSIQNMKRKAAQHEVAKAIRWAKNDFQSWADEEGSAKSHMEPMVGISAVATRNKADQLRTIAETVQKKKEFFFFRLNLAKKCGIAIPQELQSLKPADQLKAAVR